MRGVKDREKEQNNKLINALTSKCSLRSIIFSFSFGVVCCRSSVIFDGKYDSPNTMLRNVVGFVIVFH